MVFNLESFKLQTEDILLLSQGQLVLRDRSFISIAVKPAITTRL